ncbi:MAG TPA: SCO family protein [Kiritimatiellia bacterium]|nr:SCO family protein [Kiritimatiellia bacterium]HMO97803.1 SCO family protein [Kiritimatiellia bacterium]HMP96395.1 SCO family protein [Kiritimatiellia bacterium]
MNGLLSCYQKPPQCHGFTVMLAALLVIVTAPLGWAQAKFTEKPDYSRTVREMPDAMKRAGFEQRHNTPLPLDAVLTDEQGRAVELGSFFTDRPVIVTFVYYNCPMLCNIILNSLADTLKDIAYQPGRDYRIVTISFDHTEGHELAAAKKATYIDYFGKPGAADGWHFLTGDEETIRTLTEAAGFTFAWDEQRQDFAHASGIIVATPQGILSHYFFGVVFSPRDVRLGLVDASAGKIGSPLDRVQLLFCYHYDPSLGTYSLAIFRLLKLGGVITIAALALFIAVSLRQERYRNPPHPAAA